MTVNQKAESGSETADELRSLHRYRRYLLYTLCLYTPPIPLADVAHQLTVWEVNEAAEQHLDKRLEIYMALYHDHLPELMEADIVTYHQEEDVVCWGLRREQLEPIVATYLRDEIEALLEAESPTIDDTT